MGDGEKRIKRRKTAHNEHHRFFSFICFLDCTFLVPSLSSPPLSFALFTSSTCNASTECADNSARYCDGSSVSVTLLLRWVVLFCTMRDEREGEREEKRRGKLGKEVFRFFALHIYPLQLHGKFFRHFFSRSKFLFQLPSAPHFLSHSSLLHSCSCAEFLCVPGRLHWSLLRCANEQGMSW